MINDIWEILKLSDLMKYLEPIKIRKRLCDFIFLIPLILSIKDRIGKTRLLKISIATILKFGIEEQINEENIIWYRYGPYLPIGEKVIKYLLDNKIIEEIVEPSTVLEESRKPRGNQKVKYILTENGIQWISRRIEGIDREPTYLEIVEYIEKCIFSPLPQLIKHILDEARAKRLFDYENKSFSGKIHIKIFDWNDYGSGVIKPYHYTLLYSYARTKHYLERFRKKNERNWPDISRTVDYEQIPEVVKSDTLFRDVSVRRLDSLVPLSSIFEKQDPPYLTHDKIEAKNYIHNLWYIVEAVNVYHVLSRSSPTLNEIATLCLSNYLVNQENLEKKKNKWKERDNIRSKMKQMRERLIRNEINKLCDYRILKKKKYGRKYVYTITAKCFYDVLLNKEYKVLDPITLRKLYQKRVKTLLVKLDS